MADFPLMTSTELLLLTVLKELLFHNWQDHSELFLQQMILKVETTLEQKLFQQRCMDRIRDRSDGLFYVRIDKNRKFLATTLLRVLGVKTDEDIIKLFKKDKDTEEAIKKTLKRDEIKR
jgi:DNA-directed RNA polymerase subunit beta